jgi:hypothetical protein
VGTWQPAHGVIQSQIRSDGTFVTRWPKATNVIEIAGTWDVEGGGVVVLTMTNAQGVSAAELGPAVQRYKIVRISEKEMAVQMGMQTNLTVMTKR